MERTMRELAEVHGVDCTENFPKIVKARGIMGLDITVCPCAADDTDRGCISAKCLREIKEEGICHCRCYKRRD